MAHAFSGDFASPCLQVVFGGSSGFLDHYPAMGGGRVGSRARPGRARGRCGAPPMARRDGEPWLRAPVPRAGPASGTTRPSTSWTSRVPCGRGRVRAPTWPTGRWATSPTAGRTASGRSRFDELASSAARRAELDLEAARRAILRYQPASNWVSVSRDPTPRMTVGLGFDVSRAEASEMLEKGGTRSRGRARRAAAGVRCPDERTCWTSRWRPPRRGPSSASRDSRGWPRSVGGRCSS